MFRKLMIGVATVAAIAAYSPVDAFARGGHGGGGHGGGGFHGGGGGGFRGAAISGGGFRSGSFAMHGGGFSGSRFAVPSGGARFANVSGVGFRHGGHFRHHRHFRNFAPFAIGFGVPYYYNDYYYAGYPYDDCYQTMRVPTRYGWRWRQVYVCG